ncbi:MAG: type IV pilus twitching motility protein PilT [Myxococcota bacterium]|nr:type IV pilus twitching motility protein PilT [Myxococcota bacterium]
MLTIPHLLRFMATQGASDLHLSAGEAPMMRVHGEMYRVDAPALSAEDTHKLIFDVMNDGQRRTFQEKLEADFAFPLDELLRFRVNAFVQNRGEGAVFRLIPHKIPRFEDLGLPAVVRNLCEEEKGLVLVTGPTGSGKSTTLASMIDYLNETMQGHILTLEDPIEFVHKSKRSLVNQREIGTQSKSFSAALKSALREDPDVILVGELRDLETISLALTAAETGHLVFGTVHTSSAAKTVDRLVDVFPPNQQAQVRTMLSESLVGVVTQMLLHKVGGGRAAALEILLGTPAVRNLIRESKTHQIPSAMQVGGKYGMQTMEAALIDLIGKGTITMDEVRKRMPDTAAALERQVSSVAR